MTSTFADTGVSRQRPWVRVLSLSDIVYTAGRVA